MKGVAGGGGATAAVENRPLHCFGSGVVHIVVTLAPLHSFLFRCLVGFLNYLEGFGSLTPPCSKNSENRCYGFPFRKFQLPHNRRPVGSPETLTATLPPSDPPEPSLGRRVPSPGRGRVGERTSCHPPPGMESFARPGKREGANKRPPKQRPNGSPLAAQ